MYRVMYVEQQVLTLPIGPLEARSAATPTLGLESQKRLEQSEFFKELQRVISVQNLADFCV